MPHLLRRFIMPLKLPFEARKSASSVISRGILLCLLNFILRHEKVSHLLHVEAFFSSSISV